MARVAATGRAAAHSFLGFHVFFRIARHHRPRRVNRNDNPAQLTAHATGIASDSGSFWFLSENNLELLVKVLDGRPLNAKFWVFIGSASGLEYTITVTDTSNGAVKTYFTPAGTLASTADTSAF